MKFKALLALIVISFLAHNTTMMPAPKYRPARYIYTTTANTTPSNSWWDNSSFITKGVVVLGGVVGGYYAVKWIYNYFFSLTDSEAIEQALSELEKASIFHNDLAFAYHNETNIVLPTLNTASGNKYSSAVIDQLKPEITAKFSNRPYYSYVVYLDRDISNIANKKSDLSASKIRLFERKLQLQKSDNKKMSPEEKASYITEYNNVIEKISATHDKLQNLHYVLLEIRNHVVRTLEYSNESKQARIEQLERENAKLQSQAQANAAAAAAAIAHSHYYSKPAEPTHVTHVHIYHDDADEYEND